MVKLHDNRAQSRFELAEQGAVAFADYRLENGALLIDHVESPEALRGTGAAGRLMEGLVEEARRQGLKLVPHCSYAQAWLQRHPQS
ncbi:MAG: GNAT family N-acetyltransferase [Caulobacterales bacterium]